MTVDLVIRSQVKPGLRHDQLFLVSGEDLDSGSGSKIAGSRSDRIWIKDFVMQIDIKNALLSSHFLLMIIRRIGLLLQILVMLLYLLFLLCGNFHLWIICSNCLLLFHNASRCSRRPAAGTACSGS